MALILLIWTLLTVSIAASRPEGTIIKEGILTYSAGFYHEKEPISLCINTYGDNNQIHTRIHTLNEASGYAEPKKEDREIKKEDREIKKEDICPLTAIIKQIFTVNILDLIGSHWIQLDSFFSTMKTI
ncbi:hypothetical protein [Methanosarcina sp.]|uniref:hypothetical protein n=1 Tax=Methanosarcina sp. TaxID=2213 RepID=UPI003BB5C88B